MIDGNESARMRHQIMPAFTDRALMKQEPTIQSYASLMTERLIELVGKSENEKDGVIVNVVDWYNWFTFDVTGDLSLGEAFGCLRDTKNHPWVSMIFNALKGMMSLCRRINGNPINHRSYGICSRNPVLSWLGVCTPTASSRPYEEDGKGSLRNCSRED